MSASLPSSVHSQEIVGGLAAQERPPAKLLGSRMLSASYLVGAFAFTILMMIGVALLGLERVNSLSEKMQVIQEYADKLDRIHRMRSLERERIVRLSIVISAEDPFVQEEQTREISLLASQCMAVRAELEALTTDPAERELLRGLRELTGIGSPILSRVAQEALEGRRETALALLLDRSLPIQEEVMGQIEKIMELMGAGKEAAVSRLEETQRRTFLVLVLLSGGAILGTLGIGFYVVRRTRRQKDELLKENAARRETEWLLKIAHDGLEKTVWDRTAQLKQFKNTLDQTLDSVFMFAADDLRFSYVNEGAVRLLGYAREELLSMHPFDIDSEFPEPGFRGLIQPLLTGEKTTQTFETVYRLRNGEHLPVEVFLQFIAAASEPGHFVAIVRDVSERKRSEQALIFAKEEAEHANAAKSEFLSRMSHELRTPLNVILGFGQLLGSDPDAPLSDTQAENVREILDAGTHLLDLVNDILDLSRIESGRLEVALRPVAAYPVIDACASQCEPLAAARGIAIERGSGGCRTVDADPRWLKQVMLNLLSNAIKYNRPGGRVEVHCLPLEEKRLRIEVRDTGAGIDPDDLQRLFKPFGRLESAYEGTDGVGIGLALTKKLVEAMHGKVGVRSEAGEGSVFWFELPLASSSPPGQPSMAGERSPGSAGGRKLLYVDDDPRSLRLIQKIFGSRSDLILLHAETFEDGLVIAIRQRPDVVLIDIDLPNDAGRRMLGALRAEDSLSGVSIVAVAAADDNERDGAAGFASLLTKPFDIEELRRVVDRHLEEGSNRAG